jgi:hypothetical protein
VSPVPNDGVRAAASSPSWSYVEELGVKIKVNLELPSWLGAG